MKCNEKICTKITQGNRKYCSTHYNSLIFFPKRPLYHIWTNMVKRCYDPKFSRFEDWGGRGIKIYEPWRTDYFKFESDLGERPSKKHQIDRIDNNGNYEPGNVRWVLTVTNCAPTRRRMRRDNNSGHTGVIYNKQLNRYQAVITINKKRLHLGWFINIDTAVRVRKEAEQNLLC